MRTLLLSLIVLALGLGGAYLVASPSAGAHTLVTGTITGSVGSSGTPDAYQIDSSASGAMLTPGTYEFDITDYSSIHNFDLCLGTSCNGTGPYGTGANTLDKTDIAGTGSVSWMVNLTPGTTYTYQCDVHSNVLHGQFSVLGVTSVKLSNLVPRRKVVTATATTKAIGSVTLTGWLLKGSKVLASTGASGSTATLHLKPAAPLKPGYYVVQVRAKVPGSNFKVVRKQIHVM